jgi:hypothetical protein
MLRKILRYLLCRFSVATHYTTEEGGFWFNLAQHPRPHQVFAIRFTDGRIWDPVSGWRFQDWSEEQTRKYEFHTMMSGGQYGAYRSGVMNSRAEGSREYA